MKEFKTKDYQRLTVFATVTLVGSGTLCVLLLLYVVYFYSLTEQQTFATQAAMVLSYIIPALLAVVFFAALGFKPFWRISLSLIVLSTGISLLAADLFLALSDSKLGAYRTVNRTLWFQPSDLTDIRQVAREHGVEFDTRNKYDIIRELRKNGIEAVPSLAPIKLLKPQTDGTLKSLFNMNGTEALPLGGISNRVTVLCNEGGQWQVYESDEHGFHNPKGVWGASRVDAVALGDSFTQGYCVSSERNFVALIRQKYPNTLNLGIRGEGPLIMLATLKEYAQPLAPKIVLWFFFEGNDITDLDAERNTPILMQYLESNFSQSLLQRQRSIDQVLASHIKSEIPSISSENDENIDKIIRDLSHFVEGPLTFSHLRSRIGLVWEKPPYTQLELEAILDVLGKALKEAKATVESWGGKLYFVYLPERERYSDPSNAQGFRDQIFFMAENLGIPVIDIHTAFQVQADPLTMFPFRRMGHYNEQGHKTVANSVVQHIDRQFTSLALSRTDSP